MDNLLLTPGEEVTPESKPRQHGGRSGCRQRIWVESPDAVQPATDSDWVAEVQEGYAGREAGGGVSRYRGEAGAWRRPHKGSAGGGGAALERSSCSPATRAAWRTSCPTSSSTRRSSSTTGTGTAGGACTWRQAIVGAVAELKEQLVSAREAGACSRAGDRPDLGEAHAVRLLKERQQLTRQSRRGRSRDSEAGRGHRRLGGRGRRVEADAKRKQRHLPRRARRWGLL